MILFTLNYIGTLILKYNELKKVNKAIKFIMTQKFIIVANKRSFINNLDVKNDNLYARL